MKLRVEDDKYARVIMRILGLEGAEAFMSWSMQYSLLHSTGFFLLSNFSFKI